MENRNPFFFLDSDSAHQDTAASCRVACAHASSTRDQVHPRDGLRDATVLAARRSSDQRAARDLVQAGHAQRATREAAGACRETPSKYPKKV